MSTREPPAPLLNDCGIMSSSSNSVMLVDSSAVIGLAYEVKQSYNMTRPFCEIRCSAGNARFDHDESLWWHLNAANTMLKAAYPESTAYDCLSDPENNFIALLVGSHQRIVTAKQAGALFASMDEAYEVLQRFQKDYPDILKDPGLEMAIQKKVQPKFAKVPVMVREVAFRFWSQPTTSKYEHHAPYISALNQSDEAYDIWIRLSTMLRKTMFMKILHDPLKYTNDLSWLFSGARVTVKLELFKRGAAAFLADLFWRNRHLDPLKHDLNDISGIVYFDELPGCVGQNQFPYLDQSLSGHDLLTAKTRHCDEAEALVANAAINGQSINYSEIAFLAVEIFEAMNDGAHGWPNPVQSDGTRKLLRGSKKEQEGSEDESLLPLPSKKGNRVKKPRRPRIEAGSANPADRGLARMRAISRRQSQRIRSLTYSNESSDEAASGVQDGAMGVLGSMEDQDEDVQAAAVPLPQDIEQLEVREYPEWPGHPLRDPWPRHPLRDSWPRHHLRDPWP